MQNTTTRWGYIVVDIMCGMYVLTLIHNNLEVLYMKKSVFEESRLKYKPINIKLLFIAEAPPQLGSGRFFYFEDVQAKDSLFLELMKVLYPKVFTSLSISDIRENKHILLNKFKDDCFYLIDAIDVPMPSNANKTKIIKDNIPNLIEKIRYTVDSSTPIILISSSVYKVCYNPLLDEGFNIVNVDMIDFPGSGRQLEFRKKISELLASLSI